VERRAGGGGGRGTSEEHKVFLALTVVKALVTWQKRLLRQILFQVCRGRGRRLFSMTGQRLSRFRVRRARRKNSLKGLRFST
jgi:hypothetical protein